MVAIIMFNSLIYFKVILNWGKLRVQFHKTALTSGANHKPTLLSCASDSVTIDWRITQHAPGVW